MPQSPLNNNIDLPTFKIKVDGTAIKDSYQVLKIDIIKEIYKIPTASIILIDGNPADENFEISESESFTPGKKIQIDLGYHNKEQVAFKGLIIAQSIKTRNFQAGLQSTLTVKCSDEAIKLTVGRKKGVFKDKKDSDIITSIIGNSGLSKSIEATDSQYPKVVQYDCSDWDFILTRSELNGFIVNCENGKIEIGAPKVSDSPVLKATYGVDVIDFQCELNAKSQLASVECTSWDPATQKIQKGQSKEPSVNKQGNITGKKLSDVLSTGAFEMHTTVPEDVSVLNGWAKAKLLKSRLSRFKGSVGISGSALAKPNTLIELDGFGKRFNGNAYISSVNHVFEEGSWITNIGFGLNERWFTETVDIDALPAAGLLPGISGLQIGVVKKINEDPDGEYRIQVDVPVIEEGGEGLWARLSNVYASQDVGFFILPEVGDEVVLGFLNDDPRFAVILGSLYSKKQKAPYTSENTNKIKGLVTKSKMKLTFEDEKKEITLETPGGNSILISDDVKSITITDENKNKIVMEAAGITLDSAKDIIIKAKGKISLDASTGLEMSSKGDASLEGNNLNIKAKIGLSAEGSAQASLKASGQVEVKGAMVMIN